MTAPPNQDPTTTNATPTVEPVRPEAPVTGPARRRSGLAAVAAAVLVGVGVIAVALAAGPAPAAPSTAAVGASAAPASSPAASSDPEKEAKPDKVGKGFGFGFGHGNGNGNAFGLGKGLGAPSRAISITAINGSDVSLATDDGWTRTITVTPTTKITKGGQTIGVTDLKVGDHVAMRQSHDNGAYQVTALAVIVPSVQGTVSKVGSGGFTITDRAGTAWTITTDGKTAYHVGEADGTAADVTDGGHAGVSGDTTGTNALHALTVRVEADHAAGTVTAKTADSITIKGLDGKSATIHVDAKTTYHVRGKDSATMADIAVGDVVGAEGRSRSDGSLDATTVAVGKLKGHDKNDKNGSKDDDEDDAPASASPSTAP